MSILKSRRFPREGGRSRTDAGTSTGTQKTAKNRSPNHRKESRNGISRLHKFRHNGKAKPVNKRINNFCNEKIEQGYSSQFSSSRYHPFERDRQKEAQKAKLCTHALSLSLSLSFLLESLISFFDRESFTFGRNFRRTSFVSLGVTEGVYTLATTISNNRRLL